ncbi:MAG: hypothetical protein WC911_01720 [Thermoleophilia bacterium]
MKPLEEMTHEELLDLAHVQREALALAGKMAIMVEILPFVAVPRLSDAITEAVSAERDYTRFIVKQANR